MICHDGSWTLAASLEMDCTFVFQLKPWVSLSSYSQKITRIFFECVVIHYGWRKFRVIFLMMNNYLFSLFRYWKLQAIPHHSVLFALGQLRNKLPGTSLKYLLARKYVMIARRIQDGLYINHSVYQKLLLLCNIKGDRSHC